MAKRYNKISIKRTVAEWAKVDAKIPGGDLNKFLNKEILKLTKSWRDDGGDTQKREKVHYTPPETYAILLKMSESMKKPIGSIINEFIIAPLLKEKEESALPDFS